MHSTRRAAVLGGLLTGVVLFAMSVLPVPVVRAAGSCDVEVSPELSAIERAMIDRINAHRQEKGLSLLEPASPALRRAALWKVTAFAQGALYAHDDEDRTWEERLDACGYDFLAAKGENLGHIEGQSLPPDEEVTGLFNSWRASPIHEPVQTDPVYRVIGIARIYLPASEQSFWAVTFGSIPDERGIRAAQLEGVTLPPAEEDPCLPAAGQTECDTDRQALWAADWNAWVPRLEAANQPRVPAAVLLATLQFRAREGSTMARGILESIGADDGSAQ